MGASHVAIMNAGGECKAEARGITIKNATDLFLYAGVYNADNTLCFDIIQINGGMQYPDSGTKSIPVPKTGFLNSAKVYFSDNKSDLKSSLTKADIKKLEEGTKKFAGFKVSSNNAYQIYPVNSKGKPDKKAQNTFEGGEDTSSLRDKLYRSLRN